MEDKINELKQLIGSLAEDSSLRRELEKVLESTMAKKPEPTDEPSEPMDDKQAESKMEEEEQTVNQTDEEKTEEENKDDENPFDYLKNNLENLMEDNEFITAAAGFVLGAVVVGLGATLVSVLRK